MRVNCSRATRVNGVKLPQMQQKSNGGRGDEGCHAPHTSQQNCDTTTRATTTALAGTMRRSSPRLIVQSASVSGLFMTSLARNVKNILLLLPIKQKLMHIKYTNCIECGRGQTRPPWALIGNAKKSLRIVHLFICFMFLNEVLKHAK